MSTPERWWYVDGVNLGFVSKDGADHLVKCAPGQKDIICRPLQPDDLDRPDVARAYQAYVDGDAGPSGTPLRALDLGPGIVKELEATGIECVEALAALNDAVAGSVREGFGLKRKAVTYLEKAGRENYVSPAVWAELRRLEAQIDELRKRLEGEAHGG